MINKAGHDRLRREYDYIATENEQLLSYIFRCFWVGDEEEFQIYGDETDIIQQPYWDAIRSIGSPEAEECENAIIKHFNGERMGYTVIDILLDHIWNKPLYQYDHELWFSIILSEEYGEYAEGFSSSSQYANFMESDSTIRATIPNDGQN